MTYTRWTGGNEPVTDKGCQKMEFIQDITRPNGQGEFYMEPMDCTTTYGHGYICETGCFSYLYNLILEYLL